MLMENKNLKDSKKDSIKDTSSMSAPYLQPRPDGSGSYAKTNKLITALYMVTDIIDREEPLRNKLRTLGAGIISDMNSSPQNVCGKISEIMSFLDIASAVNIISEMNCNILKKEFLELNQSIMSAQAGIEFTGKVKISNKHINLSEFFREELPLPIERRVISKGHLPPARAGGAQTGTRIGVQKGSTLMKALSNVSYRNLTDIGRSTSAPNDFNILKKQRRDDIINIIKIVGGNATIKDIKDKAQGLPAQAGALISCGEKTLQRELVSMVNDGVLNKTGEKRWSRYYIRS
jgi:hypothetical protein